MSRHSQIITETDIAWAELKRIQRPKPKPGRRRHWVKLNDEQLEEYRRQIRQQRQPRGQWPPRSEREATRRRLMEQVAAEHPPEHHRDPTLEGAISR
jgi:hypothetical protein